MRLSFPRLTTRSPRADTDLPKLHLLGHFLKGSSATLGLQHVQKSCELIQNYGELRGDDPDEALTEKEALSRITRLLKQTKGEYTVAEKWLRNWYRERGVTEDPIPE